MGVKWAALSKLHAFFFLFFSFSLLLIPSVVCYSLSLSRVREWAIWICTQLLTFFLLLIFDCILFPSATRLFAYFLGGELYLSYKPDVYMIERLPLYMQLVSAWIMDLVQFVTSQDYLALTLIMTISLGMPTTLIAQT